MSSSIFANTVAGTVGFTTRPTNIVVENGIWMIGNSPSNGKINVSIDSGTTWINYTSGLTSVYGITYGLTSNNTPLWVATGPSNISRSTDSGKTWSVVSGVSVTNIMYTAAYGKNSSGDNLFMVGGYSSSGNIIFSSSNGTTWTGIMSQSSPVLNAVYGIKYGKLGDGTNVWIAVGIIPIAGGGAGLAYSTNGSSWTQVDGRTSIPSSGTLTSITYGIDDAGNKRWVLAADKNITNSPCIYTLINPTTSSLNTWSPVTSTLMTGKCFAVTFGRSSTGNVFIAAGGVGTGTGNAIVTFDGTTATGYISVNSNVPYQGSSVGYLNTGDATTSRFYATQLGRANKMLTSQYGSSWSEIDFTYVTAGNTVNGAIVSSIPY